MDQPSPDFDNAEILTLREDIQTLQADFRRLVFDADDQTRKASNAAMQDIQKQLKSKERELLHALFNAMNPNVYVSTCMVAAHINTQIFLGPPPTDNMDALSSDEDQTSTPPSPEASPPPSVAGPSDPCDPEPDCPAPSLRFSRILLDEAGQSPVLTSVMACRLLVDDDGQALLIGDRHQLPPIVLTEAAEDTSYAVGPLLGTSLLEDLEVRGRVHPFRLLRSHRMHSALLRFPSEHVYEGRLSSAVPDSDRNSILSKLQFPVPTHPLAFLHVCGTAVRPSGFSWHNPAEADVVADFMAHLLHQGCAPTDLGILTFCDAQRCLLNHVLTQRNLPMESLTVSNVDGFQGKERRVIILSCVRSSTAYHDGKFNRDDARATLGFICSLQRSNVALTRCREALFIVGNAYALDGDGNIWSPLLRFYDLQGYFLWPPFSFTPPVPPPPPPS